MSRTTREIMLRENRIIIALLGILTAIALGIVLYQAREIMLPFALAVFLAFVLDPLIRFFERRRIPSPVAIVMAVLLTFLIFNLFGVLVYTSIKSFTAEFPKYESRIDAWVRHLSQLFNVPPELFFRSTEAGDRFSILADLKGFSVAKIISSTMGSLLNFLSNTVLVLLFLLFILLGRGHLMQKVHWAFAPQTAQKIASMLTNIHQQVQRYLIAKTFVSLATGLLATLVLVLFDVQFALIWGILTFLLNFIPSIGSVIATALPLAVAFIQFQSLIYVLWIALCLSAIQFVIGNLIDPRVIGRSVNLSPLVVLFSLIFWGWLWGVIGMFLAVPIAVIIKIILENSESLRFLGILMSSSRAEIKPLPGNVSKPPAVEVTPELRK